MALKRRRLLALGGAALLAGCLGDDDPDDQNTDDPGSSPGQDGDDGSDGDDDEPQSRPTLSEDVATALGAVPEAVGDRTLTSFWLLSPERADESDGFPNVDQIAESVGVSAGTIDRAVVALDPGDGSRSLLVVVGSFGADDVAVPDEQADEVAVHAADGFAVLGQADDGGWEAGVDAAVDAANDPEAGIADGIAPVVAPLQNNEFVTVTTAPSEDGTFEAPDGVDTVAVAQERVGDRRRRQEYAVQFASADSATTAATEAVIAEAEARFDADETDVEYEQYDRTVVGSFTTQLPPSQLPDDSPEVRFRIQNSQGDGDAVTVVVRGDEPVDPANVEFRVDGQTRAPPWGDREAPIEPGEEFTADLEPFRVVTVWWVDPERDGVEQPLGREVVGGDTFESEFDPETNALVVSYTGDRSVETDRFEVSVNPVGSPRDGTERPLSEVAGDSLEPDEQFRIEGVQPGDGVSILVSLDGEGFAFAQAVFATAVEAPGEFTIEAGDQVTVTYESDQQPADQYRVVVGGEPTDVQFADEYETLTDGDQITVDADLGDRIAVEWTGRDDPLPVASEVITPEAEFEATFDADSRELTVTYAEGDPLDAERLLVEVPRTRGIDPEAWSEAYDTVEPGDAITVTVGGDRAPKQVIVVFDRAALLDRIELS